MANEIKAAHINGWYLLGSVCLTALLSSPVFLAGQNSGKADRDEEVSQITQQYEDTSALLHQKSTQYDEINSQYNELESQRNSLESRYSDLESQCDNWKSQYNDLESLYTDVVLENEKLSSMLNERDKTLMTDENTNKQDQSAFELLCNLIPVSGTMDADQYKLWDVSSVDNYGNKYTSGICMRQNYTTRARLVYALDKKYSTIKGKFVLSESGKNTDGHYTLYAYSLVDGNLTFLHESKILATATRPIDVEFSVEGVMDLVIEMYDPNKANNNAWTGFVDVTLE